MRASPGDLAIVALVVAGKTNDEIVQFLDDQEIDRVDAMSVERVRIRAPTPPSPFDPLDPQHLSSQRFLLEQGLHPWFQPDADMDGARRLLGHARARETAEALLISDAPAPWVRAAVTRYSIELSDRAVELFVTFFFDVRALDERGLLEFLARRSGDRRTDGARELAARSRGSSLGLLQTTMRIGRTPTVDLAKIVRATRTAAGVAALDAVLRDRPKKAERYAKILQTVSQALESIGDPQTDLLVGLTRVNVATDSDELPMIESLGGDHSVAIEAMVPGLAETTVGE